MLFHLDDGSLVDPKTVDIPKGEFKSPLPADMSNKGFIGMYFTVFCGCNVEWQELQANTKSQANKEARRLGWKLTRKLKAHGMTGHGRAPFVLPNKR